jgi:hypothetical protein
VQKREKHVTDLRPKLVPPDHEAFKTLLHGLDPAQQVRAFVLGAHASQADGLVAHDIGVLRNGMFLAHFELGVFV